MISIKPTFLICIIIVCFHINLYKAETTKKPETVTKSKNDTAKAPSSVNSRFFDLGGFMNQLFPNMNQGGGLMYPGNGYPNNNQNGYPNQGANQGQYPDQMGYPNQGQNNGMGNQYPNYPQGNGQYPGNYPDQNQGRQNQYPHQGQFNEYPNQSQMNQYPNQGQMNQYPNQGGFNQDSNGQYPNGPNGYPMNGNQYSGNQYPNQNMGNNQYPNNQGGFNGYPDSQYPGNNNGQFQGYPNQGQQYPNQGGDGTLDSIAPSQNGNLGSDSNGGGSNPEFVFPDDTDGEDSGTGGIGKPVAVPSAQSPAGGIVFDDDSSETATQRQCAQDCQSTSEYNPICGTNNVTYFNPGRFICARNCGVKVNVAQRGRCSD